MEGRIAALTLACTLGLAGLARAQTPAERARSLPDAIAWAVECATAELAQARPPKAPAWLVSAARKAAPGELGRPALLVLGLAGEGSDQAIFERLAAKGEPATVEHALLASGLGGGSSAEIRLGRILESRELEKKRGGARKKAIAAFALGLGPDAGGGTAAVQRFAKLLFERNVWSHEGELAACFAAFGADEGRGTLRSYLTELHLLASGRGIARRGYPSGLPQSSSSLLRGIAFAALGQRFATRRELRAVLVGLGDRKRSLLRWRAAWGLARRPTADLGDELRAEAARGIAKRLGDPVPEVRAQLLLALANFDKAAGLREARAAVSGRKRLGTREIGALLVLAKHGGARELGLLAGIGIARLSPSPDAAWCLAVATLARRTSPGSWPFAGEKGAVPPFPVSRLRARLAGSPGTDPGLVEAAAALGLAMLGDRESIERVRATLFSARSEGVRRALAIALLRLDARALDDAALAGAGDRGEATLERMLEVRLLGWAYAGAPQLWAELRRRLGSAEASRSERERALRLAVVALAGHSRNFGELLRRRIGPGELPPPLGELQELMVPLPSANTSGPYGRR